MRDSRRHGRGQIAAAKRSKAHLPSKMVEVSAKRQGKPRLQRSNKRHSLRATLEKEIVEGILPPGQPLDEKEIAARFGVSRMPVREVLLQLSSAGLVTMRPRRKALVSQMSGQQVIGMWEVLIGLEGMCAKFAARRMDTDKRERLQTLCNESREAVQSKNVETYDRLNREFHELIMQGAHNAYLERSCREIRRRVHVYRRLDLRRAGRMQTSLKEHLLVAEAILASDDTRADELMQAHLVSGGYVFSDILAVIPDPTAHEHD